MPKVKDFKSEFSEQNYKEYWEQKGNVFFKVKWYWQYLLFEMAQTVMDAMKHRTMKVSI